MRRPHTLRPLTLLQALRQERLPFVLLTVIALGLRISLLMAGPVLLSSAASASQAGIPAVLYSALCNPLPFNAPAASAADGQNAPFQSLPSGGAHDPAHCICAAGCFHGASLATVPAPDMGLPHSFARQSGTLALLAETRRPRRPATGQQAIRAPPAA